jgi:hypothetical protein
MSNAMNRPGAMTEVSPRSEACTVFVLYEDAATRQRGLAACDYLVQYFWAEVEFEFHWWRSDFLADRSLAAAAAEKAAQANLIFLCSTLVKEPSATLKAWFDSWIECRSAGAGMLVNLITSDAPKPHPHAGELFLLDISRRADLDYLGTFPPPPRTGTLPTSPTDAEPQFNQLGSGPHGLLRESPRPPQFGIND